MIAQETIDGQSINDLIESNVYQGDFGYNYIKIPSSTLDFSSEFIFMGFTPSGRIRLGEIVFSGPSGIKYLGRLARFDGEYLTVLADRFMKSIQEMQDDKNLKCQQCKKNTKYDELDNDHVCKYCTKKIQEGKGI